MKLLVTGAAGFIGSTYVRLVGDEHEVVVLDKLTYAGRRENLPEGRRADRSAAIEDPAIVREAMEGVRRGRQLRRRVPRRPLDRRPGRLRPHPRDRHRHPARRRPRARRRPLPAGLHRRGLRLDRVRLLHRDLAARPLLALLGDQGGRRPARLRPLSTPTGSRPRSCRGSNNYGPRQYPEKLIPLMVLNAIHGDSLPVYGDGRQVRNWLYVEDFCRGIHTVLMNGRPGEAYNVGGPDECENIEVVKRVIELTGARRVADRVRQRPPRPRPPLLARLRQAARRARLGGAGPLRRGPGADRRLVPRQRGVVGPDPLRRVPRVLRKAVRQGPRLMPERLETKLDGVVLLEPAVHGDERGFMVETFSRDAWAELGVDVEFVQHNHSRSSQGHPARAPLPDRAGPGEAGPLPARRDPRRRRRPAPRLAHLRPVGGARARRRRPPPALRPGRLRPRLRRAQRRRRRHLPGLQPLRPGDRGRHRLGRPRRRRRVAGRASRCSASATRAPRASPKSPTPSPSRAIAAAVAVGSR